MGSKFKTISLESPGQNSALAKLKAYREKEY